MMRQLGLFKTYEDNWAEIEVHLEEVSHTYAQLGAIEVLAMIWLPLNARFKAGERTDTLAKEIMQL